MKKNIKFLKEEVIIVPDKPEKKVGLMRLKYTFLYAFMGIKHAFLKEEAFRQEVFYHIILLIVLYFINIPAIWKVMLYICSYIILIVELLNSAIEAIVDKASPEYHELARQAKDMSSGAVTLCLIMNIFLWLYIIIVFIIFK